MLTFLAPSVDGAILTRLALLQAGIKAELSARAHQVSLAGAASLVVMTHAQELQLQVSVLCYHVHIFLGAVIVLKYRFIKYMQLRFWAVMLRKPLPRQRVFAWLLCIDAFLLTHRTMHML